MKYVVVVPSGFINYFLTPGGGTTAKRNCARKFFDKRSADDAAAAFNRRSPNAIHPARSECA